MVDKKNWSNNLARVFYPAPRSRSEKGELERQEELGSRSRIGVIVAWENSYYLKWSCNQQTRNKQKRKEKKEDTIAARNEWQGDGCAGPCRDRCMTEQRTPMAQMPRLEQKRDVSGQYCQSWGAVAGRAEVRT